MTKNPQLDLSDPAYTFQKWIKKYDAYVEKYGEPPTSALVPAGTIERLGISSKRPSWHGVPLKEVADETVKET